MTPVGNGARRPALGLILPATLQEELPVHGGVTLGATNGTSGALADLCRRAEATGADSLWAVDHLFWPHPIHECLTTLTIAAAVTRRVTVGSCVLQLPLRQPAAVAKQATALQILSGGRFVLGVGVGSHSAEYELAGVDFHRRGHTMDAGIAALRHAWATAGGPAGDYRQEPPSNEVPLWIGGASAAARRRAAAVGDAWVPLFLTAEDYQDAVRKLREETAQAGRDPDAVQAAVVVFVRVGPEREASARGTQWLSALYGVPPKAFERHLVAGPSEDCAAALGEYVEAGARHVIVMMAGDDALGQFGYVRSAFVAHSEALLAGVGG